MSHVRLCNILPSDIPNGKLIGSKTTKTLIKKSYLHLNISFNKTIIIYIQLFRPAITISINVSTF